MTLDIKRILVPLDFSSNSELALRYAHAMALRFNAALHLVHVCEVPAIATGSMDAYAWDPLESTCRHASLSIL